MQILVSSVSLDVFTTRSLRVFVVAGRKSRSRPGLKEAGDDVACAR
jgi:RNA 3'-terminal phosphate cyclase